MTYEEVVEFFSATDEFTVSQDKGDIILALKEQGNTCSTRIWNNPQALTIQQLIRCITQLKWNMCNQNYDR